MDYRQYKLTWKEKGKCLLLSIGIGVVIAYLFYDHWLGLLLIPLLFVFFYRSAMAKGKEEVQSRLAKEFLDTLRTISAALLAGCSIENAWREAEKEIRELYGEDAAMYQELVHMNQSVRYNMPIESLLEDFAVRSGNADIASFSEVFSFAKRSGGNFETIIKGTEGHMRMRYETEREIQVLVAARKLEQKVMNFIPILILTYLKLTSADMLDSMYGNPAGILFMTGCLAAYAGAIVLANRILAIHM